VTGGLPRGLSTRVTEALSTLGRNGEISRVRPVGGGCIHNGSRLETDSGDAYFLKWSSDTPAGMFDAEADGLRALGAVGATLVPEPLAWSDGSPAWLLMEFVEAGPGQADTALGEALARIHGSADAESFGWERDNWIGSLPQRNPDNPDWGAFWRDARLGPQLFQARRAGRLEDDRFDRVVEAAAQSLSGVVRPELVHGDLWSGNAFSTPDGRPVLVDPAVYIGDGEVDLAMSELFGGFGKTFYDAYNAARPVSPEYVAFKRDLYQLYYLLVHVNLFGSSYEAGARRAASAALQGMGYG
jgi:fructosamine-3-kinase